MKKSQNVKYLIIALSVIFGFGLATAGDPDDYKSETPLNEEMPGQIYIEIRSEFAPLQVTDYDGIAHTGISSIDEVSDRHGVFEIYKIFRMQETPTDPNFEDLSRIYLVSFPDEYKPRYMMEEFLTCPEVEFSEPLPVENAYYIPNDSRYRSQWYLEQCGFPEAWNVSHGSEEIVIGIVDSGLDMNVDRNDEIHEDFLETLWLNPEEDQNENGVLDFDDWNYEDDDDNGYADDFYGWDFTGRDNWPDDRWGADNGHGTHVAGIASAVTDNETGIAGAAFNCKLLIAACYHPQNDSQMANTDPAMEYCTDMEVDVINVSWGHFGRSYDIQRRVFANAVAGGVAVFSATGNDNELDEEEDRNHFYPTAYPGVIGVSASNRDDNKAGFSNYGDFSDIVAPGVGILSAVPRNRYTSWQGTSMASPLAAGLGALMLSVKPDLTSVELMEWMQRTAVDISGDDNYPGIRYRIDADKLLNSTHPKLGVVEWSLDDSDGNNNGRAESGELVYIDMTVNNEEEYTDAHSIVINLTTKDESLTIVNGETELDQLANGDEAVIAEDQRLSFRVNGNTTPHHSVFQVSFDSEEGWIDTSDIKMIIEIPYYVLVDDDGGSRYESFYEDDLDSNRIVYDTWSIETEGIPAQGIFNHYDFAIWETGNVETPLTDDEINLLSGFLDNGGSLLITGQFIGDSHGDNAFHSDYLHARHLTDDTGERQLFGSPDNPASDGVTLLLIGGGAAGNGTVSPSGMEPLEGAEPFLYYGEEDSPEGVAGIIYEGDDHRVVYLGFALEAVTGIRSTTRDELIALILDRFFVLDVPDNSATSLVTEYELSSPWPNPFNAQTSVRVAVPGSERYTLSILDLRGRVVESLHEGIGSSGIETYTWDAGNLPAGLYMVRLSWNGGSLTRKLALIK